MLHQIIIHASNNPCISSWFLENQMLKLLNSKDGLCAVNQPLATRLPPTYTWLRWDPTRPLWPPNQFLYCRHIPSWGASKYLLNWKSESVRPPLLQGYWNSTDTRAGSKPRGGNTTCHDYIYTISSFWKSSMFHPFIHDNRQEIWFTTMRIALRLKNFLCHLYSSWFWCISKMIPFCKIS